MLKKILVTGSSGFVGSHVADELTKIGHQVVLFDNKPSPYKKKQQQEYIGDILSSGDVEKAIDGCEYVYHFAGQADIGFSSKSPVESIKNNILGTLNLLELARKYEVERFLFASTIYVYSELGSFYRVSKQSCEKIIEEYQKEFGLNYTILRYGSLYGPRANDFNAMKHFLTQAIKEKKITRNGNGEELREYIHVKDASSLSITALKKKYRNQHLFITGNQQIRVKDLLKMIIEIFDNKIEIHFDSNRDTHHYEITPFNFKPQIAKKIIPETFYDLGQGILDLIYDIDAKINNVNNSEILNSKAPLNEMD